MPQHFPEVLAQALHSPISTKPESDINSIKQDLNDLIDNFKEINASDRGQEIIDHLNSVFNAISNLMMTAELKETEVKSRNELIPFNEIDLKKIIAEIQNNQTEQDTLSAHNKLLHINHKGIFSYYFPNNPAEDFCQFEEHWLIIKNNILTFTSYQWEIIFVVNICFFHIKNLLQQQKIENIYLEITAGKIREKFEFLIQEFVSGLLVKFKKIFESPNKDQIRDSINYINNKIRLSKRDNLLTIPSKIIKIIPNLLGIWLNNKLKVALPNVFEQLVEIIPIPEDPNPLEDILFFIVHQSSAEQKKELIEIIDAEKKFTRLIQNKRQFKNGLLLPIDLFKKLGKIYLDNLSIYQNDATTTFFERISSLWLLLAYLNYVITTINDVKEIIYVWEKLEEIKKDFTFINNQHPSEPSLNALLQKYFERYYIKVQETWFNVVNKLPIFFRNNKKYIFNFNNKEDLVRYIRFVKSQIEQNAYLFHESQLQRLIYKIKYKPLLDFKDEINYQLEHNYNDPVALENNMTHLVIFITEFLTKNQQKAIQAIYSLIITPALIENINILIDELQLIFTSKEETIAWLKQHAYLLQRIEMNQVNINELKKMLGDNFKATKNLLPEQYFAFFNLLLQDYEQINFSNRIRFSIVAKELHTWENYFSKTHIMFLSRFAKNEAKEIYINLKKFIELYNGDPKKTNFSFFNILQDIHGFQHPNKNILHSLVLKNINYLFETAPTELNNENLKIDKLFKLIFNENPKILTEFLCEKFQIILYDENKITALENLIFHTKNNEELLLEWFQLQLKAHIKILQNDNYQLSYNFLLRLQNNIIKSYPHLQEKILFYLDLYEKEANNCYSIALRISLALKIENPNNQKIISTGLNIYQKNYAKCIDNEKKIPLEKRASKLIFYNICEFGSLPNIACLFSIELIHSIKNISVPNSVWTLLEKVNEKYEEVDPHLNSRKLNKDVFKDILLSYIINKKQIYLAALFYFSLHYSSHKNGAVQLLNQVSTNNDFNFANYFKEIPDTIKSQLHLAVVLFSHIMVENELDQTDPSFLLTRFCIQWWNYLNNLSHSEKEYLNKACKISLEDCYFKLAIPLFKYVFFYKDKLDLVKIERDINLINEADRLRAKQLSSFTFLKPIFSYLVAEECKNINLSLPRIIALKNLLSLHLSSDPNNDEKSDNSASLVIKEKWLITLEIRALWQQMNFNELLIKIKQDSPNRLFWSRGVWEYLSQIFASSYLGEISFDILAKLLKALMDCNDLTIRKEINDTISEISDIGIKFNKSLAKSSDGEKFRVSLKLYNITQILNWSIDDKYPKWVENDDFIHSITGLWSNCKGSKALREALLVSMTDFIQKVIFKMSQFNDIYFDENNKKKSNHPQLAYFWKILHILSTETALACDLTNKLFSPFSADEKPLLVKLHLILSHLSQNNIDYAEYHFNHYQRALKNDFAPNQKGFRLHYA